MALSKRWRRFVRLAAAAALLAAPTLDAAAQDAAYDADQVKAAFLYHFGTYVQWPAPAPGNDPITIAVLDDPAVAAQLAAFLPGRSVAGRVVEAVPIDAIDEVGGAEIVFIGQRQNERLAELIAALEQRPTLVVTDADDGLDHGAMVNLKIVDSRVRFEISVPRAEEAGLRLSSRLLSAALRVETSDCCRYEAERGFAIVKRANARRRG